MQKVKNGDTVQVHYHGKLEDGSTFDSSEGRAPLEFKVGSGQVIKGFDEAVMDMQTGDKKTVNIPVDKAYGAKSDEAMIEFPRAEFPEDMKVEEGMALQMSDEHGNIIPVVVQELRGETVILDANHPLAGKDLTFDLELVGIV